CSALAVQRPAGPDADAPGAPAQPGGPVQGPGRWLDGRRQLNRLAMIRHDVPAPEGPVSRALFFARAARSVAARLDVWQVVEVEDVIPGGLRVVLVGEQVQVFR